jgi:hypothetical protein
MNLPAIAGSGSVLGNKEGITLAIRLGANTNIRHIDGPTALELAKNKPEIFELLINTGIDISLKYSNCLTPFETAIKENDYRSCKLLFDKIMLTSSKPKIDTPLFHLACKNGNPNIVEMLIKLGAEVDAFIPKPPTYFQQSVSYVFNFVSRFTWYTPQAPQGDTALHIAAKHGHLDVVELLIRVGANKEIKDYQGKIYLDYMPKPPAQNPEYTQLQPSLYPHLQPNYWTDKVNENGIRPSAPIEPNYPALYQSYFKKTNESEAQIG